MFQLFFQEYKREIYIKFIFHPQRYPLFLYIFHFSYFIFSFFIFYCMITEPEYTILELGAHISVSIALLTLLNTLKKETHNQTLKTYKKEMLEPLATLLKNEKYNLYSINDIESLISMCNFELSTSKKVSEPFYSFSTIVIPTIALFIGNKLDFLSIEKVFSVLIAFIIIWFFMCIIKFVLSNTINEFPLLEKKIILSLKNDLLFLLNQLKSYD